MSVPRLIGLGLLVPLAWAGITQPPPLCGANKEDDLAAQLLHFDADLFAGDAGKAKRLAGMLWDDARKRIRAANERESERWRQIKTKSDWQTYRDARLRAMRESLGPFPQPSKDLKLKVTRTLDGEGYRIENIVFESRPGLLVTANLYAPGNQPRPMPGILICPSHHNPRTQGELQDMGMSWGKQPPNGLLQALGAL